MESDACRFEPEAADKVKMAPRMGPTHVVEPMPATMPKIIVDAERVWGNILDILSVRSGKESDLPNKSHTA